MEFKMPEELATGKSKVDSWLLCEVLMMHDAYYPGWLVLVPRRSHARELFDLSPEEQAQLMQEICRASGIVQRAFSPDKLNVGALGNVVPQLHVHVVPRFVNDIAWPGPVWGAHPSAEFPPGGLEKIMEQIKAAAATVEVGGGGAF